MTSICLKKGLYNKDMTRILCYPAGIKATEFFVPDTVKTIGDFCILWHKGFGDA